MAKFELKFMDIDFSGDTIETNEDSGFIKIIIRYDGNPEAVVNLDKSTAIKFAKTLRTEINKITESEVNNG